MIFEPKEIQMDAPRKAPMFFAWYLIFNHGVFVVARGIRGTYQTEEL